MPTLMFFITISKATLETAIFPLARKLLSRSQSTGTYITAIHFAASYEYHTPIKTLNDQPTMNRKSLLNLNPDTKEYVRKLYNLDEPGKLEQLVNIFDQWIKKQSFFLKKDYDRTYLEAALISSKGSVEKAKEKLENICVVRTMLPRYFTVTSFRDEFQDMCKNQCCGVITPNVTPEHNRAILYKLYNDEYFQSLSSFLDFYRHILATYEYLKVHDFCAGYILIYDFRDISISSILSRLNLVELKNTITILMKTQGMKIKKLIYISPSKTVETLVKLINPFLPPKIAGRVQICKTIEEVHELVPKDILPVEFGGTERSFKTIQDDWIDLLSEPQNLSYLADMQRAGVDHTYQKMDTFQHMAGSFVSLNVD